MKNFLITMKKLLRKYSLVCKNKERVMYCVNIGLALCIFALLFLRLNGTNEASTEGFTLRELYLELGELKADNKELTLKSAEKQSITRVKEVAVKEFGMIESGGQDYIVLNKNKDIVKK